MIKIDLHTHTNHSHGQNSVEEMFERGKLLGLDIMGFSEHSPRPPAYSYLRGEYREHLKATFENYIHSILTLKQTNAKPKVLLGLEMDYFPQEEDFIRETLAAYPYDYVIGGLHFLGTWGFDHSPADWEGLGEDEKQNHYLNYYNTLTKLANSGLMNIVAHPDLIKIFSVDCFREWLQEKNSLALVEKTLTAIKKNNMAMEISSAGLRKPCKEIYPCPAIMGMAAEMNIPVTFASDAHCINTIGHSFDVLEKYAKDYGYSQSVYFYDGKWHEKNF